MLNLLKGKLQRTKNTILRGFGNIFLGKKEIDKELIENIESSLLLADFGVLTTKQIIDDLTQKLDRKELKSTEILCKNIKEDLCKILESCSDKLIIDNATKPFVILMVGVNGAGKTTTIGKLAKKFQKEGKKVMLAAGDTFRAAAVEQLQIWGERNDIPVISQKTGADSAAVIFDAMSAAKARNIDVLIADTAGRLHTQDNLMHELKKIKKILTKIDPTAPHETILVLDACIGQNALVQAREFNEIIKISGIIITKLDGTAKGGIIFSIAKTLNIPIRFIGVGESIDDLQDLNPKDFVDAIFE